MDKKTKIDPLVEELNKSPTKENWAKMERKMKKDKAKMYYIFYPSGLKSKMNLKQAYAVIYNAQAKPLYKLPILMKDRSGIEGATYCLKELQINRKMI
ncbi:MAG TPA: hypothetical protein VMV00_03380 [Candidatus Baltobacteraceae bacterium]|nr:hypothetical protein [Candidatus Baltobacteraceae bacterium]